MNSELRNRTKQTSVMFDIVALSLAVFLYLTSPRHIAFAQGILLPVCEKSRCGYIDKEGRVAIPLRFDEARKFSDGLGAVRVGIKWGFIDPQGDIVIEPRFNSVGLFIEGLAPVQLSNKWGFLDRSGKMVIEPRFDDANSFSYGFARVRLGQDWAYIDMNGREPPVRFVGNPNFSDDLTAVEVNGKIGYVDRSLKHVIQPGFEEAGQFNEGLAPVRLGNQWGYINKIGQIAISPRFMSADEFCEGLAVVQLGLQKKGYINRLGEIVISPQFSRAYCFSEGLAPVLSGGHYKRTDKEHTGIGFQGGQWMYIDRSGKVITKLHDQIDYAGSFTNGLAFVRLRNGKEGYIAKDGNYIWKPSK
jgi:WG repeat protein